MKRKIIILGMVMSGLTSGQDNLTQIKYDINGNDERVYKISQDNYDKYKKVFGGPEIDELGIKENNMFIENYLECKKEKCLDFDIITYKEVLYNY
jgi:hypothetical protein